MSDYVIVTDSSADLPKSFIKQWNLPTINLRVFIDGTEEDPDKLEIKAFYDALRGGKIATTAAPNLVDFTTAMEPILQSGKDLLYIAFSSGLSGTCQAGRLACEELAAKYPERKIKVVDSLAASTGQGLFVYYALKKQQEGVSFDDNVTWLEENKLHVCHWFTVDDLMFLKRGGRISAVTAVVGTMLSVKPVLHVDNEGHLINMSKTRGRKAAILALVEMARLLAIQPETQIMMISNGDCLEDAEFLAEKLKSELGVPEVLISSVGPVIGAHSGPGTLALFFLGAER